MKETEQKNFLRLKKTNASSKTLFRTDDQVAANLQKCYTTLFSTRGCEESDKVEVISESEADTIEVPVKRLDENGVEYVEMVPCVRGEKITGRYGKRTLDMKETHTKSTRQNWIDLKDFIRMRDDVSYAAMKISEKLNDIQKRLKLIKDDTDKRSVILKVFNLCMSNLKITNDYITDEFISEIEENGFMVHLDSNEISLVQIYQKLNEIDLEMSEYVFQNTK